MTELENKMEALRFEKEKLKADLEDKGKEREFKKGESQKDRKFKREEGKKDRIPKYIDSGAKLGQMFSGTLSNAAKVIAAANDPEWYNHYPQMLKDTASFGFRMPKGVEPRAILDAYFDTGLESWKSNGYPGMLIMPFIPTLGSISGNITDPINIASYKMYNYMRTKISGNTKLYQPADVARLMVMYDSIYSFMGSLYRIYSLINQYKVENRYYNRPILYGLIGSGTAVDNLLSDPSRLRGILNRYATAFASIPFPKGFDFMTRHFWMSTNIFRDSPSVKAAEYMFTPYVYYVWDSATASLKPRRISFTQYSTTEDPFECIEQMLSDMLNSIYTSSDVVNITNDILKTFSESALIVLPQIAENYTIESLYSPEVLSQINNSTIFTFKPNQYSTGQGKVVDPIDSLTIWQKTASSPSDYPANVVFQGFPDYSTSGSVEFLNPFGILVGNSGPDSDTTKTDRYAIFDNNFVVNVTDEKFTDPKLVAVATRCMASASVAKCRAANHDGSVGTYTEFDGYFVDVLGSEILVNAKMITIGSLSGDINSVTVQEITDGMLINLTTGITGSDTASKIGSAVSQGLRVFTNILDQYSQFDWAPNVRFILCQQSASGTHTFGKPVVIWPRDLEYYTVINKDQLKNLHYTCLTSMFHHKDMDY